MRDKGKTYKNRISKGPQKIVDFLGLRRMEMIVASGFIETNEIENVERVVSELKARGVEVNEVKDEKIVFLVERDSASEIKKSLDSLKDIDGVRSVYLVYYSLEGGDMETISIIVQIREVDRDALLEAFKTMSHVSVYGVRHDQIILTLDTDDIHVLAHNIKEIQKMDGVIVVHPVFSHDSLPF